MPDEFIPASDTSVTEESELQSWIEDANDLDFLTRQRGWSIILEDFDERKKNATDTLIAQIPGDEKAILAAHAVAHAVVQTCNDVISRVEQMIYNGDVAKQELQIREDQKKLFDEQQNFI